MTNKHLIDLIAEFPRLKRKELAEAMGVPESTFNHWTNKNESRRKAAPEWTKAVVNATREKLVAVNSDRFKPAPVAQPTTQAAAPTDPLFLVSVPASKVNSFRGLVAMVGGSIVDM